MKTDAPGHRTAVTQEAKRLRAYLPRVTSAFGTEDVPMIVV